MLDAKAAGYCPLGNAEDLLPLGRAYESWCDSGSVISWAA